MGYDLKPKNKKIEEFHFGVFVWPIVLQETGMGYVVGYGAGLSPATYVYKPDKIGASPVSNDGYSISSSEAKMMAIIARGFVSVQRFINKELSQYPEDEQNKMKDAKTYNGKPLYNTAWHEDRLVQIEQFANFAESSKGFRIH
jgi:hypothetical protein